MTAEIVILNQLGVALAADSAVTIGQSKVYNTANKLFALSKSQPVAIMVYGGASFMGIPWETLVKVFRRKIVKDQALPKVKDYGEAFVEFLRSTPLVGSDHEEKFIRDICVYIHQKIIEEITKRIASHLRTQPRISAKQVKAITRQTVVDAYEEWEKSEWIEGANEKTARSAAKKYRKLIVAIGSAVMEKLPTTKIDQAVLIKICSEAIFRKRFLGATSGIVIAGFGEDQIYPEMVSYMVVSRVAGLLKVRVDTGATINVKNRAVIRAFAQREMVYTFMEGIDPNLQRVTSSYLQTAHKEVPGQLASVFGRPLTQAETDGVSQSLAKLVTDYEKRLKTLRARSFVGPVIDAVCALPLGELAVMAETLVNLTSFKRKMTLTTESVGGPIDVAVISKGDGLVWIKRKHYFQADLNKQYFDHFSRT